MTDMERLASRFTLELHLNAPSLGLVVREAVHEAHGKGLQPERLREFLAMSIEDGLGYRGEGLHHYLNPAAYADWKGICGRAFDKALARVMSYGDRA